MRPSRRPPQPPPCRLPAKAFSAPCSIAHVHLLARTGASVRGSGRTRDRSCSGRSSQQHADVQRSPRPLHVLAVGEHPGDAPPPPAGPRRLLARLDRSNDLPRRSTRRAQTHVVCSRTPGAIGRRRGRSPLLIRHTTDGGLLSRSNSTQTMFPDGVLRYPLGSEVDGVCRARRLRLLPRARGETCPVPAPCARPRSARREAVGVPRSQANWVSRMPDPTASRTAPLFRVKTSCQGAPAVRRKTTQPAVLPQLGIASDAAIAWLPRAGRTPRRAPGRRGSARRERLRAEAEPFDDSPCLRRRGKGPKRTSRGREQEAAAAPSRGSARLSARRRG